jgi:hypothetical protein
MIKVYIEWNDAYTRDDWETLEDAIKLCKPMMLCKTIGWIINEDNNQITICHTYNPHMVMGNLHIPKGTIKKIKRYEK